jgi:hypothetical protein
MKLPPKQNAISVGQFLQSPGLSIIDKENEVFAGHSKHCPNSVSFSPGKHFLTYNSNEKSISETNVTSVSKKVFDDILLDWSSLEGMS